MSGKKITLLLVGLLIVDQAVKIWVKTHMTLGEGIAVFPDWFFIKFIENPGAAFGMQLGSGSAGKLFLSLFRCAAFAALVWYLVRLVRRHAPKGVVVGFGLILAGAVGNIVDSAVYGLVFSESTYTTVATAFPDGGGYAGFLHGRVVDMLYFPLFSGTWPGWFPFVGGDDFTFFSPVFNIADSYINIGIAYLLLFQRKFFK